jgi:hypothetical protein
VAASLVQVEQSIAVGCNGCTYCCWAYCIEQMPVPVAITEPGETTYEKRSMQDCPYSNGRGCEIHESPEYPSVCREFTCPYLELERGNFGTIRNKYTGKPIRFKIHVPDWFRAVVEEVLDPETRGRVFPAVPASIGYACASELVRETGCIPVIHDGLWQLQMLNKKDPNAAMTAWRNCG